MNCIFDKEYRIIITPNYINVINYTDILEVKETKIIIKYKDNYTDIYGSELLINKLLDKEIRILGKFKKIEYR